jgi:hypothetical protein
MNKTGIVILIVVAIVVLVLTAKYYKNVQAFLFKTEFRQKVCMVLIIMAVGGALQYILHTAFSCISTEVIGPLRASDTAQSKLSDIVFQAPQSKRIQVLQQQYKITSELKRCYLDFAMEYNTNSLTFTNCFIIFTSLTSLLAFLLAHQGWQNCGYKFKSIFLSCGLLASIYGFTPTVLDYKDNLSNNLKQMKVFEGAELGILDFASRFTPKDSLICDKLICKTDSIVIANYNFFTTIDPSKINDSLIQKALGSK